MATPLSICTKEEVACNDIFLWAESIPRYKSITHFQHNVETGLRQGSVYKWISVFKNDLTSVTDEDDQTPGHIHCREKH
jgi:hypothetical protein